MRTCWALSDWFAASIFLHTCLLHSPPDLTTSDAHHVCFLYNLQIFCSLHLSAHFPTSQSTRTLMFCTFSSIRCPLLCRNTDDTTGLHKMCNSCALILCACSKWIVKQALSTHIAERQELHTKAERTKLSTSASPARFQGG